MERVCFRVQEHGFLLNLSKCKLIPTMDMMFIGAKFHTDLNKVFLPDCRAVTLRSFALNAIRSDSLPVGQWLKLWGHMAASVFTVPWVRLHLRPCWIHLLSLSNQKTQEFEISLPVLEEIRKELVWWTLPVSLLKDVSL